MRAAVYCRLSVNPDGATIGLEAQEADGRAYATRMGATSVDIVTDDDLSAHDPDKPRPGFERLLAGIHARDFDIVVARDQARYARNPVDLRRITLATVAAGVELHTVATGRLDVSSPEMKMYVGMMGLVDENYVDKIKVLTRRAAAERARRGLPFPGYAGFGYTKTADDNYAIVELEADEIRDAAARVLASESLRSIALDWNARGLRTRRGKLWTAGSLRRVLLAPRIAGLREHQGQIVGKATWPAILDEPLWKRVGRTLRAPDRRKTVAYDPHLLTGIATCGVCVDRTLNSGRARQGHRIYVCRHCRRISIQAEGLEAMAEELVLEAVEERAVRAVLDEPVDLTPLKVELDDIAAQEVELAVAWASGSLPREAWDAARSTLAVRKAELEGHLNDAEISTSIDGLWQPEGLLIAWDAMTTSEKRMVARRMFRVLEVLPAKKGRVPFDRSRVRYELV